MHRQAARQRTSIAMLRAGAALIAMAGLAIQAQAQESSGASSAAKVEKVVVTAQKRPQTLQSVPVAVSVVDGEAIEDSQIRHMRDLPLLVPSLNVTQAASSGATSFSLRGLGTSSFNAGLEPAVGVFIDGVYRSRQAEAIGDFIDIERIEVLRGPQSTLFGRNTSAGVISIITKLPQFEFGADGEVTVGNYSSTIVKGSVTGPLIEDTLAARVSASYNNRDGFVTNLLNGEDVNNLDRWSLRGQLLYTPNDDITVRIIGDTAEMEEKCCAAPFFFNDPVNVGAIAFLGGTVLPTDPFSRNVQFDGVLAVEETNSGVSAQVDWDLGSAGLTSITALRRFHDVNDIDSDFTDLDLAGRSLTDTKIRTFTQEIRLASEGENRVDWLVGAYYLDQTIKAGGAATYGADLRAFADLVSDFPPFGSLVSLVEFFEGQLPGTYLAAGQGLISELYVLDAESFALFGNVDFHVTDKLTLSGGLRWTTEDKEIDAKININDPFAAVDLSIYGLEALQVLQFFPPSPDFATTRSESNVSGKAVIAYEATEDLNLYASYARGYKGGGFNVSSTAVATGFDFDPEIVDAIELGAKGSFFQGRANVYVALFDQQVKDFQAIVFNGTAFVLQNAGEIGLQGVELETVLRPVDSLTATLGVTYLDAVIESFPNGPCPISEPGPTCDLGGHAVPDTSKWTVSSTATYTHPLSDNTEGFIRGELNYRSSRTLMLNGDPHSFQKGTTLINASAGVSFADGKWELSIWGKNLTDEEFAQGIFDSVAQAGSFSGYPNDPTTYGVTLRAQVQ